MTQDHVDVKHRVKTVNDYKEVYDKAKKYINDHIEIDNLVLDDFCTASDVSRRQAQRSLAWFGTSWRQLLAQVRMQEATRLLRESDLSNAQVARKIGYRQPAQFVKAFKRHCNVHPNDYRRDHARA